jgi:hypothetical protein
MSLDDLRQSLQAEEARLASPVVSDQAAAYGAAVEVPSQAQGPRHVRGGRGGRRGSGGRGHRGRGRPWPGRYTAGDLSQQQCAVCGGVGHLPSQCPNPQNAAAYALAAQEEPTAGHHTHPWWYVDFGATFSCTPFREYFTELHTVAPQNITVADGTTVCAQGVGTVRMHGEFGSWDLQDVMFVPHLSVNLVSVAALISQGITPVFENNQCILWYPHERVVDRASCVNGQFPLRSRPRVAMVNHVGGTSPTELWHARLGHIGYDRMIHMLTGSSAPGRSGLNGAWHAPHREAESQAAAPCLQTLSDR